MSSLSIGLFTYSTRPRGSVVHAACLAEALADAGHAVTLYALDKDGAGFFRSLRVPFVRIPARPAEPGSEALIAQRIGEVSEFVARARLTHDALHAEDCLVASGLLSARAELERALVCRTVHHVERFESPYLEQCQARSIREADLVLSVSAATESDVRARYGRLTDRIENGVDCARFDKSPDGSALRQRFGIARDAPLVVSLGGVEPRKNTIGMLQAFVRARRALPELRWLIAGGASIFEHAAYQSAFAAQLAAQPSDVERAVIRTGVLEETEIPLLYAAADVLLCASLQEGFGLCVLEAMAARRAVVVSRGAPFDEYLDDSCALRVDPHDPSDIARTLVHALTPAPERLERARLRAESFGWPRCAARHGELYQRALAQRGAAAHIPRRRSHA